MKATNFLLRQTFLCFVLAGSVLSADDLVTPHQVKQTPEVVEAYRVCETFEHVLGENLDFDRAYEATFTKDVVRRRAIAIADGEFGDQDFASMDDKLVIKAYKLRMQILYLMLPLAGPSDEEAGLFFPPDIKEILQRKVSNNSRGFRAYVSQLERDVVRFRSHLELLTSHRAIERLSQCAALIKLGCWAGMRLITRSRVVSSLAIRGRCEWSDCDSSTAFFERNAFSR